MELFITIMVQIIQSIIFCRWFYYKRNDKLNTEQLWKARILSEYQRSFYQNLDRSYYTSERDKKITTVLF
uniref:Uncharacterized protein n=1 Tax=Meloidogyne enterolobii TaxID=390850 RepID=A0A6V7W0P7_MELEN|nr:unnamed protein product [Meloidogyne enterolobii]